MFRPMLVLTRSITIFHELTRLAHLEADASLLAALGAALDRCIFTIIHEFQCVAVFEIPLGGYASQEPKGITTKFIVT